MAIETLSPEQLYTSEEVTDYLRVSLRTTQRLLKSGQLNSFKIHGQYRIKGLDLLNYLNQARTDHIETDDQVAKPADLLPLLMVPPLAIEISAALTPLFAEPEHSPVLQGLEPLRKKIMQELGFIFPGIRCNDNLALKDGTYQILIHGSPVIQGHLKLPLEESASFQLLEHLHQTAKQFAHEILSREEVALMIENLRLTHHVIIDEVLQDGFEEHPRKLTIGQLTRVLKGLLREQVSIRNLRLILEGLADALETNTTGDGLVEKVRQSLTRQICSGLVDTPSLTDESPIISVITLDADLEKYLCDAVQVDTWGHTQFKIEAKMAQALMQQLKIKTAEAQVRVIICSPLIRLTLRRILERNFPDVTVLSYVEVGSEFKVRPVLELAYPQMVTPQ